MTIWNRWTVNCDNPLLIADSLYLDIDSNVQMFFLRYVMYKDTIRCNAHGEHDISSAMHMLMLP